MHCLSMSEKSFALTVNWLKKVCAILSHPIFSVLWYFLLNQETYNYSQEVIDFIFFLNPASLLRQSANAVQLLVIPVVPAGFCLLVFILVKVMV